MHLNLGKARAMEQQETRVERLDAVYQALPPLGSPEYVKYLDSPQGRRTPPEVLARAYRELRNAKQDDAAEYTLQCLLGLEREESGLAQLLPEVRRRHVEPRRDVALEDLLLETANQIVHALHRGRGKYATENWGVFGRQRVIDAWRKIYGRTGLDTDSERVDVDPTTGEDVRSDSPLFEGIAPSDDSESGLTQRLLEFIDRQLASWSDPTERALLKNRVSPDPIPISSKEAGRPNMASKLGLNRDQVNRAESRARTKLKAAILTSGEFTIEEIRQVYPEAEE